MQSISFSRKSDQSYFLGAIPGPIPASSAKSESNCYSAACMRIQNSMKGGEQNTFHNDPLGLGHILLRRRRLGVGIYLSRPITHGGPINRRDHGGGWQDLYFRVVVVPPSFCINNSRVSRDPHSLSYLE